MASPYSIIFIDSLEEDILTRHSLLKPLLWWRYIEEIFKVWDLRAEKLKKFLETINCNRPTIKFTAEHSKVKNKFSGCYCYEKG